MTDDILTAGDPSELEDEIELEDGDIIPPPIMSEDGEDVAELDDAAILDDEFSPVEAEAVEEDSEDPDAYLYNRPTVKFADSAEEDEAADWMDTNEEF